MANRIELHQKPLQPKEFKDLSDTQRIKYLLSFGVHAPSTHNTQPWKFHIKDNSCVITTDDTHVIAEGDRDGRYAHISLGACTENIVQAAQVYGYFKSLDIRDDGTIVIVFAGEPKTTHLSAMVEKVLTTIQTRQNYRGLFTGATSAEVDSLVDKTRTSIKENIFLATVRDDKDKVALVDAAVDGIARSYGKPAFRKELANYLNHNFSKRSVGLHGYSLGLSSAFSVIFPHLTRHKDIGPKAASLNGRTLGSASTFVVFGVSDQSPKQFTQAGMAIERFLLLAHESGIAASIFVAPLEFTDTKQAIKHLTGLAEPCLIVACGKQASNKVSRYSHRIHPGDKIVV